MSNSQRIPYAPPPKKAGGKNPDHSASHEAQLAAHNSPHPAYDPYYTGDARSPASDAGNPLLSSGYSQGSGYSQASGMTMTSTQSAPASTAYTPSRAYQARAGGRRQPVRSRRGRGAGNAYGRRIGGRPPMTRDRPMLARKYSVPAPRSRPMAPVQERRVNSVPSGRGIQLAPAFDPLAFVGDFDPKSAAERRKQRRARKAAERAGGAPASPPSTSGGTSVSSGQTDEFQIGVASNNDVLNAISGATKTQLDSGVGAVSPQLSAGAPAGGVMGSFDFDTESEIKWLHAEAKEPHVPRDEFEIGFNQGESLIVVYGGFGDTYWYCCLNSDQSKYGWALADKLDITY